MKITILFFSTNRLEFLIPSLDTFFKHVNFGKHEVYSILIDDYPKDRDDEMFRKIQKKYNIDKLILHENNEGYSKTWKEGWDNIPENTDYIFHQEDDFTYHTEIEISPLIKILKRQPKLYQIVLKRQIWYEPPNSDLIYKLENSQLETFEESFNIHGKTHYITGNRNIFNANPCIYPYFITQLEYGNTIQEHMILSHLLKKHPDMYGCFYGKRLDAPLTTHIGHFTQGKRMLPGEPGYEAYKIYNPDKKYDAKKWLTEYKSPTQINKKQLERNKKVLYFETIDDANRQSDVDKKIDILQKAIHILPEYLDAYYFLMMEYQDKKEYLKAYITGISVGNKWKNYKLFRSFTQQDIYKRLFYLNLALNAYYAEFYDEAFIINKRILDLYPNDSTIVANNADYFICGPSGLMQLVENSLKDMSVDESKIHLEYFTAVTKSESAEEEEEDDHLIEMGGDKTVKVDVYGDEQTITVSPDKTILEAAQDAGLDPPYSCTVGVCTTCRAKVLSGKVRMDEREGLSDAEIEDGFVLTCQAHPITNDVELTYE